LFGIGGFELFIILLFGFLIFGPDKLPEMAKTLGAAIRKFKQAKEEMETVIKGEVLEADNNSTGQAHSPTRGPNRGTDGMKPAGAQATQATPQESFAERKARFDRERAQRAAAERQRKAEQQKQQEEIEANRRAMKDEAAKKAAQVQNAQDSPAAPDPVPSGSANGAKSVGSADAATPAATAAATTVSSASAAKPHLSPEELFGVKPLSRTAQHQDAAASSTDVFTSASTPKGGE